MRKTSAALLRLLRRVSCTHPAVLASDVGAADAPVGGDNLTTDQESRMMNGHGMAWHGMGLGMGMGFRWPRMIVILVLVGLAIAVLIKYLAERIERACDGRHNWPLDNER